MIILDVTRTVSRVGLGPATGIDRVERAWIDWALSPRWPDPRFLARVSGGEVVFDAATMRETLAFADGAPPPPLDLRGRLSRGKTEARRRVESHLRRAGACASGGDGGRLYANVGHANLTPAAHPAARAGGAARSVVLIHDVIPLERPDLARKGGAAAMGARLAAAATADGVIYNSADTRRRAEAHMPAPPPPGVVAPLGVAADPSSDVRAHGGVVILGTIEPRKNHALLLDIWAGWPDAPTLHIVGRRGWMNEAVFAALDGRPANVIEHGPLSDDDARALVAGARALLTPSLAEGYGLPLAEALAARVPVVASDLPALRETGGDAPIWLDPTDRGAWRAAIAALADAGPDAAPDPARADAIRRWRAPTWASHFRIVDEFLTSFS